MMNRHFSTYLVLALLFASACKNYNPNSNLEAKVHPSINDQNEDPSSFVDRNLKIMYPNIGNYILEKKIKEYEVNFQMGGSKYKVTFDLNGNWKKSKVSIRFSNKINMNVKSAVHNSDYKNLKIVKKELEEKPGLIEYSFSFQDGETIHKLKYNQQGEVIKYEKKSVQILR